MTPDPQVPEVHPFTLMRDPATFVAWQREVGIAEADRQIEEAIRAAMETYGVRVVLPIAERMDHLIAQMEEF